MKEKINNDNLEQYGIILNHEKMDSGELRFRMYGEDGSGYARTVSTEETGWQNSHFHKSSRELYIVQKGWIAFAEYIENKAKIKILKSGDFIMSNPGITHNVFMAENTVLHTVKFGEITKNDWTGSEKFDNLIKKISAEELLNYE